MQDLRIDSLKNTNLEILKMLGEILKEFSRVFEENLI